MSFAGDPELLELVSATSPSVYPSAIAVAVLEFILFFINIPAFIWHVGRKNIALSTILFWTLITCLMHAVNAVIWKNDDIVNWWKGYGLCDIESKLILGKEIGMTGAVACAVKALAKVMNTDRPPVPTKAQRQRELAFDLFFCWGFAIIEMAVHYIVQPYRFMLIGIEGCNPAVDSSWPSIPLLAIWPTALTLLASYYSVVLFVRLIRYRSQISSILQASNTTKNRFFRLFILTGVLTLALLPSQIYNMYVNVSTPLIPYDWNIIHGPDFQLVVPIPSFGQVSYARWMQIAFSVLIFFFLGTGADMKQMYKNWLVALGLGGVLEKYKRAETTTFSTTSGESLLKSMASKAKAALSKTSKISLTSTGATATSKACATLDTHCSVKCAKCQQPILCNQCQHESTSTTSRPSPTLVNHSIDLEKDACFTHDKAGTTKLSDV